MFCRHCGNQLADDAKFCNKCGGSVAREITEPKTAATFVVPETPLDTFAPSAPVEQISAAPNRFEPVNIPSADKPPKRSKKNQKPKKGTPGWVIVLISVLGGLIILGGSGLFVYDAFFNHGEWLGINLSESAENEDKTEGEDKDKGSAADEGEDKGQSSVNQTPESKPVDTDTNLVDVEITNFSYEWHDKMLCLNFDIANNSGMDLSVDKISFQLLDQDGDKVVASHQEQYYGMTLANDETLCLFAFFSEAELDRSIRELSEEELLKYTLSYEIFYLGGEE